MKLIKKLFIGTLLISFLIALCGCNSSTNDEYTKANEDFKKDLNNAITTCIINYNKSKGLIGDIFFETHKVYGMETKEDNLYIYLVSSIQGYVFTDDKLKTGSGSCSPVRLILKKDDHKFVEYKEPVDGMELNDSLKELFPEKYYKMASKYTNSQDLLVAENKNKAIEWLKQHDKSKDSLILP